MAKIAFENGRISDFQGLVTLTLDRVILHTVVHHSLTSTYKPNFTEIEDTFCGRTDGRTFDTHFIRSTQVSLSSVGYERWPRRVMPLMSYVEWALCTCLIEVGQKMGRTDGRTDGRAADRCIVLSARREASWVILMSLRNVRKDESVKRVKCVNDCQLNDIVLL